MMHAGGRLLPCAERRGSAVDLAAFSTACSSRSRRTAALRTLESGMRRDGFVTLHLAAHTQRSLDESTAAVYLAGTALFSDEKARTALSRERLYADGGTHLAMTYMGIGEEPLYNAKDSATQQVHSLNFHEVISEMEIDQRLPPTYDGEERTLAHAYHAMAPVASERHGALLDAAAQLRRVLTTSVCEPMLRAFALLLGLDERALSPAARGCAATTPACFGSSRSSSYRGQR